MGFSCEDDFDIVSKVSPSFQVYSRRQSGSSSSSSSRRLMVMDGGWEDYDSPEEMEFWLPLQHPVEPPSEDHPIKCPIPHNSSPPPITAIPKEKGLRHQSAGSSRAAEMKKDILMQVIPAAAASNNEDDRAAADQTARALRKRHHAHTLTPTHAHGDIVITPIIGINTHHHHHVFQTLARHTPP